MPLPSHPPKEGTILQQQLTQDDAVNGVVTFSTTPHTIEIYNTDSFDGVFTVNGIPIYVPAGDIFRSLVGGQPSKEVSVTGSTQYIVSLYT